MLYTAERKRGRRVISRLMVLAGLACLGAPSPSLAQDAARLAQARTPLKLDGVGSFYVGGRPVAQSPTEIGLYAGGSVIIDQMYVQYMLPAGPKKTPIVLVHGGVLSGKTYETTPDGRMGWYEYFTRKQHPTYVVDQVGRGRSGFDQAPYNRVRAREAPPASQGNIRRVATDIALVRFRVGSADGRPFPETQFPVEAAGELAKQTIPDLSDGSPSEELNVRALALLSQQLEGAVLVSHSQSGRFPLEAALRTPRTIRAVVSVEPPGCNATVYSDAQIAQLSRVPILIVFGDYLDAPQTMGIKWNEAYRDCMAFVARVRAANGNATLLHTPELGMRGNSHMLMQDRNNLQIADLILEWLDGHLPPAGR
ncbi:conserved hypothetical protein [Phenylobacterium zucineum HLK1]|uniref:AB hydrolase-1 domain-containing protein n=1 Tax=Phenylobacterium zucineum (strain HLK1) TaxID=450851 RepID=B4RFW5_PHEZH|nr:hypothetical protein [Phenylobacterium zucineum]ACG78778.1 conserved hypothetical protein [Phenylobacterium zucineum HLK1]